MIARRTLLGSVVAGCAVTVVGCATPRLLPVGAVAPEVVALDAKGTATALSAARGRPVVVYFYPKDGTPGCTKEACAFRDAYARFERQGVVLMGVSRDSAESHRAFMIEHRLPFPLVPDERGDVSRAWGVPSNILGMSARVSFLVGPDGRVARVFPDVDPALHADEVLAAATSLASARAAPPDGG